MPPQTCKAVVVMALDKFWRAPVLGGREDGARLWAWTNAGFGRWWGSANHGSIVVIRDMFFLGLFLVSRFQVRFLTGPKDNFHIFRFAKWSASQVWVP
jgi:hypothetical protein